MTIKILVIEDNVINLELITYLLRAFGYTVITASDGDKGIELAHRERVDLIICDIYMPKVDGYEVASHLKQHPVLKNIPLIAVTALAMVGDRDKILAAGFDGYINKPIIPEIFVDQINCLIHSNDKYKEITSTP